MRVVRGGLFALSAAIAAQLIVGAPPPALSQQNVIGGGIVASGRAIATTWCSACHLVGAAAGAVKADIPTFESIAQRLPADADVLAAFIANPHPPMPNLGLSRQDIKDLMAFLATLR